MTSDAPVLGEVRLSDLDQQVFVLAMLRRRLLFFGAITLVASAFAAQGQLVRRLDDALAHGRSVPAALLGTLPTVAGTAAVVLPLTLLVLLLFTGLVLPLNVRRMGGDRRALTYRIDEAEIFTRDGMGAELALPWSNVARVVFTRRMLLVRLRPRGWRLLPMRTFAPCDIPRIRERAARCGALSRAA